MPFAQCPGCQASLEIPAVVPGGLVACPHCNTEFAPPASAGGGPRRGGGGPRRGGGGPRRGGGGGRPRPRSRQREEEEYDEDDRPRGRFRKKQDPIPVIVALAAVVLLGGAGIAVFFVSQNRKAEDRTAELGEIARIPPLFTQATRVPDRPNRSADEYTNIYNQGDRVTIKKLTHNANLFTTEYGVRGRNSIYSRVFELKNMLEPGETVTAVNGEIATHEGTYQILEYTVDRPLAPGQPFIQAQFQTDRLGRLVPGSFAQTSGPPLSPPPLLIGNRNFGILPLEPVRHLETWGADQLTNEFARYIRFDGQPFESIPIVGARQGGWRWEGGDAVYESDGVTWARGAKAMFKLKAWENRSLPNGRYNGEPADITATVTWKGHASYDLRKRALVEVNGLTVTISAQAKTATRCFNWDGMSVTYFTGWKDP